MQGWTITRAVIAALVLIILLLAVSAWIGFPWGYLKNRIAAARVGEATAQAEAGLTLSAQDELDRYLVQHDQTNKTKERAKGALRSSATPRPTDDPNGEAEARRRYDAWRAGIVSLCPDCAASGVADQPAAVLKGL